MAKSQTVFSILSYLPKTDAKIVRAVSKGEEKSHRVFLFRPIFKKMNQITLQLFNLMGKVKGTVIFLDMDANWKYILRLPHLYGSFLRVISTGHFFGYYFWRQNKNLLWDFASFNSELIFTILSMGSSAYWPTFLAWVEMYNVLKMAITATWILTISGKRICIH